MLLKKHKTGLEYLKFPDGTAVSNPFSRHQSIDVGDKPSLEDIRLIINNSLANHSLRGGMRLELPLISKKPVAIFSDGVDFIENHEELLEKLNGWLIVGTNGVLKKWKSKRKPDYYLCINPFEDCLLDIPDIGIFRPPLLASLKCNSNFIKSYDRTVYFFAPPGSREYQVPNLKKLTIIEDYRTPIGCAISVFARAGVDKTLIAFGDESFNQNRSGSVGNRDGTFCYSPQKKVNKIIDGLGYWLKQQKKELFYFGRGMELDLVSKFDLTN